MDGYALNDGARGGVENMALDQHLLETAAEQSCVYLRVYRWSQPTLSLGYFQPYVQRLTHSASSELPVVRRATGGGAIVHHYDWTYCIAVPQSLACRLSDHNAARATNIGAAQPLYDRVHEGVVEWLSEHGIAAQQWNQSCEAPSPATADRSRRFLCFERRSCGDVVYGQHKVLGSAQRRSAGAVLQHGSLLLATSPYAPSLHGLSPNVQSPNLASSTESSLPKPAKDFAGDAARLSPLELTSQSVLCLPNSQPGQSDFFQRLVSIVSQTCGVELKTIRDFAETPCCWQWPRDTRYADNDWTHRI